jgi:two-component system, sensor histidine kinase RegB
MMFKNFFKVLPQHDTLRRIVLMRSIALMAQLLAVIIVQFWLKINLDIPLLLGVILFLAGINAWTWRRMQRIHPASDTELFGQLFIDVATLTVLLYFSGGVTNPFVSLYLPVLAVAAAILPWRFALVLTLFSLACYSCMTSFYIPLHVQDPDQAVTYHLSGMWANFALSAGLITWFVARMSGALRQRDAQLAQAREQHLQSGQIVALGTQAASAAHEMGSPLSTVAVIVGDLLHEASMHPAIASYIDDLTTIETQITLCKASLDRMRMQADAETSIVTFESWIKNFIEEWRLRYPAIRLSLSFPSSQACLPHARATGQILLTLLDNAAKASASTNTPMHVSFLVEQSDAIIQVQDEGAGIDAERLKRLGYEPVQSDSGGQGIGLMLAFSTARQIGATLRITSMPTKGTTASLTIPLT